MVTCSSDTELASIPHSHLAVHDIREVKVGQQVSHMQEGLSIFFYNSMITRHKRKQNVTLQLLKTLHLIFRELLQDGAFVCSFEVS